MLVKASIFGLICSPWYYFDSFNLFSLTGRCFPGTKQRMHLSFARYQTENKRGGGRGGRGGGFGGNRGARGGFGRGGRGG